MSEAVREVIAPLDTPVAVIALEVVERNIERLQAACNQAGVANRPHIKTHKSVELAHWQLTAGAVGITCQKLGEAEVMADAGISDILLSYNIVGTAKHERLHRLAQRCTLILCCDSRPVADGYAQALAAHSGPPVRVLVECDTGRHRCGVTTPEAVAELAAHIAGLPGLAFDGLLLYPPDGALGGSATFVAAARTACAARGLAVTTLCSGGTPNRQHIGELGETEYRAGTYVYNDRQMLRLGAATLADCALTVIATVISSPEPGRVMIDAGSKSLSSDLAGFADHGLLLDYPDARLFKLAEEHGFVDVSACARAPVVGEQVRVLPNHACVVSNLADHLLCTRGGQPAGRLAIDARGRVA